MEPDIDRTVARPLPLRDTDNVNSDFTGRTSPNNRHGSSTTSTRTPSIDHEEEAQPQDEKDIGLAKTRSAAESVIPPPVKVPKSQRRGLFGRFTIIAEVEEPKHYSRGTKWFITFIIAMAAVAAPFGSTIILPSLSQITVDLDTTPTVTNLSVAFYMLSMSIFPLWWSSFSETLGRRTIYLVSFALFLLLNVLAAISTNIAMLIIFRLLGGGAAASVQAVGAGTIADIWEVRERGKAMGVFYLGPLMGPLFAPIIGGVLAEKLGWRSAQWALGIYGGVLLLMLFFALPETLKQKSPPSENPLERAAGGHLELSRTKSSQKILQTTSKTVRSLKRCFLDPLKIILCLRFPAVAITVYYASITFGCLYLLNISIETTFSKAPYNFNTIEVGLSYIPASVGYLLASLFGGRWTDKIMAREARRAKRYDEKGKLVYRPADRMRENAWIAAFLYPSALIWYGWSAEKGIHWVVPPHNITRAPIPSLPICPPLPLSDLEMSLNDIGASFHHPVPLLRLIVSNNPLSLTPQLLANFFFGVGSMLIFAVATTMLTEFMPRRASAGVAANNFVRNIFSSVGAIVAEPLIQAIGNGWLFTIMGCWAMASCVVVWAMRRYGERWRARMDGEEA